MADEEDSTPSAWLRRIGDWRSWAHTLSAAAVGATLGWAFPWLLAYGAFGGVPGVVGVGLLTVIVLGAALGGISVALHRGRYGLWLSIVGVVVVLCMLLGMFVFATRTFPPASSGTEWRLILAGASTTGGFALLSWPGPARVLSLTGLSLALILLPQWPRNQVEAIPAHEPPPPGPVASPTPFPTFPPYRPKLAGLHSFDLPGVIWPDAATWSFTRTGTKDIVLTLITYEGVHDPCADIQLAADPYLGPFETALTCEPADVERLTDVTERTSQNAFELSTVIDGHLIRAVAPATTSRDLVAEALRTAVPMTADQYDLWREERVDPYY